MVRALSDHQQRSRQGLQGFLDEVSLDRERTEEKAESAPGVTLITLHAAKGLEFPQRVPHWRRGWPVLPHERSKAEGAVDEERRLLYVGITRAMRSLVITWCRARRKFWKPHALPAQPFPGGDPRRTGHRRDLRGTHESADGKGRRGRAIRTAQGAIGQTLTHFVAEAVVSTFEFDRRLIQGPRSINRRAARPLRLDKANFRTLLRDRLSQDLVSAVLPFLRVLSCP